ncbi:MAG: aminoacyl-tRNA hydrolase [Candidatus Pacebacteria bacterium]|nr:aminoacyl-tRNA hydrolase [Candidatus Paceibacterota bacterium]MBP9715634.1 aminoacyl-tRNA hydrolase [Candidatus Paceibacterota bacterium]
MKLIIGLGNPGEKYLQTRHNVAWIIFDNLNKNLDWNFNKYANSNLAHINLDDEDIIFAKPETFMNDTGSILPYLVKEYNFTNNDIIVVQDDIDLPLGKIKISHDRGDGGHNGIKSIMSQLSSREFVRIRVGVSILDDTGVLRKPDVLGNFSKEDLDILKDNISPLVSDILTTIVSTGYEKAMTKYN